MWDSYFYTYDAEELDNFADSIWSSAFTICLNTFSDYSYQTLLWNIQN